MDIRVVWLPGDRASNDSGSSKTSICSPFAGPKSTAMFFLSHDLEISRKFVVYELTLTVFKQTD